MSLQNGGKIVSVAIGIPTYNRSVLVKDFLIHCAEYYIHCGVDIYIYDSSDNEYTRGEVERWNKRNGQNVRYIRLPSDMHSNMKALKILQQYGMEEKYDFIWLMGDGIQYKKEVIDAMLSHMDVSYDMVELCRMRSSERGVLYYDNADEFLRDSAWNLTLYGAAAVNVKTMLGDADWEEYERHYSNPQLVNYAHVGVYFRQACRRTNFRSCSVRIGFEDMPQSKYKLVYGWRKNFFHIMCDVWVNVIEDLPSYYTYKEESIKNMGRSFGMMNRNDFLQLRAEGLYSLPVLYRYYAGIRKVSEVKRLQLLTAAIVPKAYFRVKYRREHWRRRRLLKKFHQFCGRYNRLYLYGAGLFGYAYAKYMDDKGLRYEGFCVTKIEKDYDYFAGHKVFSLDELERADENTGFIVAVGMRASASVIENLENAGYKGQIFYEYDLYRMFVQ